MSPALTWRPIKPADHAARRVVLRTTLALVSGFTTATSGSVSAWASVAGLRISIVGLVVIRLVSVTIRSRFAVLFPRSRLPVRFRFSSLLPVCFRLDAVVFFACTM